MMKEWQNEGGWDKYPPNPTRNRIAGEWGNGGMGKLSIKGGEVQQKKGFGKIMRKDLGKNKREKVVIVEKD